MTVVLDHPYQIEWYRRTVMIARMKLEISGLRFRINTCSAAKKELGLKPSFSRERTLKIYHAYHLFLADAEKQEMGVA